MIYNIYKSWFVRTYGEKESLKRAYKTKKDLIKILKKYKIKKVEAPTVFDEEDYTITGTLVDIGDASLLKELTKTLRKEKIEIEEY